MNKFALADGTHYESEHSFDALVAAGKLTVEENRVDPFAEKLDEAHWLIALDAWYFHLATEQHERVSDIRKSPGLVQQADDIVTCCVMLQKQDAKYYTPRESTNQEKNLAVRDLLGAETPVARRIIQTVGLYNAELWPSIGPTFEDLRANRTENSRNFPEIYTTSEAWNVKFPDIGTGMAEKCGHEHPFPDMWTCERRASHTGPHVFHEPNGGVRTGKKQPLYIPSRHGAWWDKDDPWSSYGAVGDLCLVSEKPPGFGCTRAQGHTGSHHAHHTENQPCIRSDGSPVVWP